MSLVQERLPHFGRALPSGEGWRVMVSFTRRSCSLAHNFGRIVPISPHDPARPVTLVGPEPATL
jgi:hypothetical protein